MENEKKITICYSNNDYLSFTFLELNNKIEKGEISLEKMQRYDIFRSNMLHIVCDNSYKQPLAVVSAFLILEKGMDVNDIGSNGSTALHNACKNINISLVQLLLAYGANVQIRDSCCIGGIYSPSIWIEGKTPSEYCDSDIRILKERIAKKQTDNPEEEKKEIKDFETIKILLAEKILDKNKIIKKIKKF